jgi:hypothetical protein
MKRCYFGRKPVKNIFKVPRAEWSKWGCRERYIFNRMYYSLLNERTRYLDFDEIARFAVKASGEYDCDNKKFP